MFDFGESATGMLHRSAPNAVEHQLESLECVGLFEVRQTTEPGAHQPQELPHCFYRGNKFQHGNNVTSNCTYGDSDDWTSGTEL